jgi:Tfp pilus assembly protein PilW
VSEYPSHRSAGFTISELMIGIGLSLIVMTGVLSSYVFVARSYSRTIGFGMPNQPTLEAQGRRTLGWLAQDVPAASAISAPTASEVTLTVPSSTGGTKTVTYYYNSTAAAVSVYSVSVPANALARIDRTTNTALTLHSSLLTCVFSYYDEVGNPYTTYVNYLLGIKQISVVFTAQAGSSVNGTLTQVYKVASPRLLFRNKSLLP